MPPKKKTKKKLEDVDADEFMRDTSFNDDTESENDSSKAVDDAGSSSEEDDETQHKADLEKLKEKDPEFYKYLQENDAELLDFGEGDDDDGQEDVKKKVKFASDVGSDEDEEDDDETVKDHVIVTPQITAMWSKALRTDPSVKNIRTAIGAFKSAVEQASGQDNRSSEYVVKGSIPFNAVMKLCLMDLVPALHKALRLPPVTSDSKGSHLEPAKSRNWKRFSPCIRHYLMDVVKVASVVAETSVVCVLLKHILTLIPFYVTFPKITKVLLKKIVSFWATGDDSVRVLAFLCIVRLGRNLPSEHLESIMKQMYMSFVRNSKFTSPSTWPHINFMKQSIVELCSLDQGLAYTLGFVYIRQLSIHLRNAITIKKKDSYQAVYNWQYVHSLMLWARMLYTLHPSEVLQPLIYPLVQVTLGTIRLIPSAKYIPLRLHLIRELIKLSKNTDIHIPILPLLLEVLDLLDVNAKHTSLSMRPIDFSCALKLSKSQLRENGFKDATMNGFQELLMEYLSNQSHTIAFPELVFPLTIQLKAFCKKCKVANYNRQIKQILDKVEETSHTIVERRKKVSFGVADKQAIDLWEQQNREKGTPLSTYYANWRNVKENVRKAALVKEVGEKKVAKKKREEKEEEDMDVEDEEMKEEDKSKKKKDVAATEGDYLEMEDIVEDLKVSSDEEEQDEEEEEEEEEDTDEDDD